MISIVDVKVSRDLKHADIYLSFYSEDKSYSSIDYFNNLKDNFGAIKFKIGNDLKTKYIPNFKFHLSDDFEYYDKINKILKNDT